MQAKKQLCVFALACIVLGLNPSQAFAVRRFVNQAVTQSGNGSSWALAFQKVEEALAQSGVGDEIWVARGTYKPPLQSASFVIPRDVKLFGGFVGTETSEGQRNKNPFTNGTVLSGDLGIAGAYGDNCLVVVVFSTNDTLGTVDGFTITGGKGAADDNGAGIVLGVSSRPTIANCRIVGNRFRDPYPPPGPGPIGNGAGLYVGGDCRPVVQDCSFENM